VANRPGNKIKPEQVQLAEIGFRTVTTPGTAGRPAAYSGICNTAADATPEQDESLMLTGDENLIEVNAVVQYAVGSPTDFLLRLRPGGPDRAAAETS
jgi:regulator of protease activity HflC (stomatin/prohibitin superfamily)